MKFIKRLKTDRKFLLTIVGVIIAVFFVPYLAIPVLAIWWFYKTSKFSRKFKMISTFSVVGLFAVLIGWVSILYAKDAEPHLTVTEPTATSTVKAPTITVKGTYSPSDRTVEINGQTITSKNGSFQTTYRLTEGENKIDVQAGNWRWIHVYLTVTRELTDAEKAARITPTQAPKTATASKKNSNQSAKDKKDTSKNQVPSKTPIPSPTSTPSPTKVPTPTPTPIAYDSNGFPEDAQRVTVAQIVKVPSAYQGKRVTFTCTVLSFPKDSNGNAAGLNCSDPNDYSSILQVDMGTFDSSTNINKDDTVAVYGMGEGSATGTNAFGGQVSEAVVLEFHLNDLTTGYNE